MLSMPCQVFPPAKFSFPCNLIRLSLFLSSPLFNAFSARYGSPKRQLQFYRYLPVFLSLSVSFLCLSPSFCLFDQSFCAIFSSFVQISLTYLWLNVLSLAFPSHFHMLACLSPMWLATQCHYLHLCVITSRHPAGDCYCLLQWQSCEWKQ